MSTSLKKIKKILPAFTPEQVRSTVSQALISDEKSREELFSTLKGKGLEKEIATSFLAAIKEKDSNVLLDSGDLAYLREHFSLLGSESSIQFFDELTEILKGGSSQGSKRNAAVLMEFFLGLVNILSYSKLRQAVKEELPSVVQQLWKQDEQGIAAFIARQLLYVLLVEKSYLEVEDVDEVWNEMLNKSMKASPVIALLTVLLSGTTHKDWTTVVLTMIDTSVFPSDGEKDAVLSLTSQMWSIFNAHKENLLASLSFVTSQRVVAWILEDAEKKGTLDDAFSFIVDCHSSADTVTRLLVSSAFSLVVQELEKAGTFQNKAEVTAWYQSLISLLEDGEEKSKPLQRHLTKFIEHISASGGKLKKVKCPDAVINVFNRLGSMRLSRLPEGTVNVLKAAFLVSGTVFSAKAEIVSACILQIASLIGQVEGLPLKQHEAAWLGVFYDSWLSSVSSDAREEVAEAMITLLAEGLKALPNGFDAELLYLRSHEQTSELTADLVIRIAAFCESAPWRHYHSLTATQRDLFIYEVKSTALDKALAAVDVSNNTDQSASLQGFVYNLFKNMTREERINILPLFLTSKQRKRLSKSALKIFSGSTSTRNQSTVRKALDFFITNSHGCAEDDSGHISNLVRWPCLLHLHSLGIDVTDIIPDASSAENILKEIPSVVGELSGEDVVSLVVVAERLTRRVTSSSSEQLLDVLISLSELAVYPTSILSFCAELVKLSATGTLERQFVALSLTIAATFNEINFDSSAMFAMESLLYSCLRFTLPAITNDQCATYSHLVTKHFRGVQFFSQHKKAPQKDVERMVYGCARIAHLMAQHSTYFSRIVCSVVSETLLGYQHIELAMCKLHSISDKHSSALLATTLPPAEKRQYSRVFPEIKKSLKRIH